ncbi:hypothetical protein ACH347_24210 [Saccharopolyspora sp. 5N102]|uniref:hypothetical protein n=1 Tax=Saccharopolyspora sp. 5N102 TaxID=3375155 RepID=UPI0037B4FBD2
MAVVPADRTQARNSREFIAHHPNGIAQPSSEQALTVDIYMQRLILPIIREATLSAAAEEARRLSQRTRGEVIDPFA